MIDILKNLLLVVWFMFMNYVYDPILIWILNLWYWDESHIVWYDGKYPSYYIHKNGTYVIHNTIYGKVDPRITIRDNIDQISNNLLCDKLMIDGSNIKYRLHTKKLSSYYIDDDGNLQSGFKIEWIISDKVKNLEIVNIENDECIIANNDYIEMGKIYDL